MLAADPAENLPKHEPIKLKEADLKPTKVETGKPTSAPTMPASTGDKK